MKHVLRIPHSRLPWRHPRRPRATRQLRHARHRQRLPRHPDHPPLARNAARRQDAGSWTSPATRSEPCNDIPALTIFDPRAGNRQRLGRHHLSRRRLPASRRRPRRPRSCRLVHRARIPRLHPQLPPHLERLPAAGPAPRRAPRHPDRPRPRADYHINPNRIVVIGFSAGGHLAALAGTQFVPGNPDAEDPNRPRLQPSRLPRPRLSLARRHHQRHHVPELLQDPQPHGPVRRAPRQIRSRFCLSPKTRRRPSSTRPLPTRRSLRRRASTFIRRC